METNMIFIWDEETTIPIPNDSPKLNTNDSYVCTTFPFAIEIFRIDDEKNTVTFKCLNPKKNETFKTISISEYLDSMRKYTYLYSECSLYIQNKINLKILQFFRNVSNLIRLFVRIIY